MRSERGDKPITPCGQYKRRFSCALEVGIVLTCICSLRGQTQVRFTDCSHTSLVIRPICLSEPHSTPLCANLQCTHLANLTHLMYSSRKLAHRLKNANAKCIGCVKPERVLAQQVFPENDIRIKIKTTRECDCPERPAPNSQNIQNPAPEIPSPT